MVQIEFSVSGTSKPSSLFPSEVEIVDGKGTLHEAEMTASTKGKEYWDKFLYVTVPADSEAQQHTFRWLYAVPSDAIGGSSVRFQGMSYPLKISN